MQAPEPDDECARLAALRELDILDTAAEPSFDGLTELAAGIVEVPIALVSLVDQTRQWFKSRVGLDATETSRSSSFCAHAILTPTEPLVVGDTLQDERFRANPLVAGEPGIRAYLGIPVRSPEGHALGTLCAIDTVPRHFEERHIVSMRLLAAQVEQLLVLRRDQLTSRELALRLADVNESLETFNHQAAHDLRAPARAIRSLVGFIREDHPDASREIDHDLSRIEDRAQALTQLIDALLEYSRLPTEPGSAEVVDLVTETTTILESLDVPSGFEIETDLRATRVETIKMGLLTCVRNLIDNAITHHPGPTGRISVSSWADGAAIVVEVADDGAGIEPAQHERIFEPFVSLERTSSGLGLAHVRRLVRRHGAALHLDSAPGHGATFQLHWPTSPASPA